MIVVNVMKWLIFVAYKTFNNSKQTYTEYVEPDRSESAGNNNYEYAQMTSTKIVD